MRPAGDIRTALLQALCAGAVGTFDAIAAHAGVPPSAAQNTLATLRREGKAVVHGAQQAASQRGRPRAVYGAPLAHACHRWELDRLLSASWR